MRLVISVMLVVCGFVSSYALDVPTRKIEDDSSLRIAIKDSWFLEAPNKVLSQRPLTRTLAGGDKVQVRAEAGKTEFVVILARERNNAYTGWAQGSWVLTRQRDTGAAIKIRTFL